MRFVLAVAAGFDCAAAGVVLLLLIYVLASQAITDATAAQLPDNSYFTVDGHTVTGQELQNVLNNAQQSATHDALVTLLRRSISALVALTLIAFAFGYAMAGRVLRPLGRISAAARRISASSLHERLALEGPDDELKELGDTLDALLSRLKDSFDAQQRFAANASHELRTPLTRERTLLQVTLIDPASTLDTWQAVSRELLASNAEQERLIEGMLTLASSEAGLSQREPLDLAAIASAALADPRPGIGRLGLSVRSEIQPAALEGDPLLIQQLVTNLIDNAVRHNIPGGDVLVSTGTSGGRAVLSVTNTGPVIPPAEVDRLFQPFQRLGPRQARRDGGHGLGLSIVRTITIAHDAALTVRPRPDGGLAIDVAFPSLPLYRPNGHVPDPRPAVRPSALYRVMRGTGFAHRSQPRDGE